MDRLSVKEFKKRWARINEFQENELRKLSIHEKLDQLSSIVYLATKMKLNFGEDHQKREVRSRWILLKRAKT